MPICMAEAHAARITLQLLLCHAVSLIYHLFPTCCPFHGVFLKAVSGLLNGVELVFVGKVDVALV